MIEKEEEKRIYIRALQKWHTTSQVDMAIEECAELIQALQKRKRASTTVTSERVLEEMVDVTIMLEQLKLIYDYIPGVSPGQSRFEQVKEIKLKRLLERLSN